MVPIYISDVAKWTGLTKKAIRYYEQEGLIAPDVDTGNQYRDYSDEDVRRLLQVSLLRQMDFSVNEIRNLLENPEMLEVILQGYAQKLESDVQRLQRNQQAIQAYLNHTESATIEGFTEYILALRKGMEEADQRKQGFIKRQLLKMFPGVYGKMIWLRFAPFLNGALDTPQKENAWRDMIEYLDNAESLDVSDELKQMFSIYTEEELEKIADANYENVMRIANASADVLNKIKQEIYQFVTWDLQSEVLQKQRADAKRVMKPLKNQMMETGYYEHVVRNIRILSPEYNRYHENLQKIQTEIGLKYDSNGDVIIENEMK